MTIEGFIEECRAKNVPINVLDAPPIAIDPKATTAELLREEEALAWHRASAEDQWGPDATETRIIHALTHTELTAINREIDRRWAVRKQPSVPPWPDADHDKRAEWDEVKRRTDIQELAARVLPPYGSEGVRRGPAVWWSCWNHADSTPSLAVYDDGHFHCFGCHAHGDCIDLARGAMQLSSFQATMAVLGAWAGVTTRTIAIQKGDETIEVTQ